MSNLAYCSNRAFDRVKVLFTGGGQLLSFQKRGETPCLERLRAHVSNYLIKMMFVCSMLIKLTVFRKPFSMPPDRQSNLGRILYQFFDPSTKFQFRKKLQYDYDLTMINPPIRSCSNAFSHYR